MNISLNSNMVTELQTRRRSFGIGSLMFLVLFGVVFIGAGVAGIQSTKINPHWARESGQVLSASPVIRNGATSYTAVVQYSVNSQSYQVASSTSSSVYPHIGDTRQVAYNPSQPNQAKLVESVGSTWWLYLFPAIGALCLVIAPVSFIKSRKRSGDINTLVQSGIKLQGILTGIQNMGGTNNSISYRITVSATDTTGTVQNYVSDTVSGIGGLAMADYRNNPIPIDVYVNPADPKDYYVDVSDIPNLTPDRIAELIQSVAHRQPNTFTTSEQPPVAPSNPTTQPPTQTNL